MYISNVLEINRAAWTATQIPRGHLESGTVK